MSSDIESVRRVIQAFEASDWAEIDVRIGSLRVHLRAHDADGPRGPASPSIANAPGAVAPAPAAAPAAPATGQPQGTTAASAASAAAVADGAFVVRSPSPGIFWRSPQPGAPPFADAGQHVDPNSTLCIVEVMKLMNHVKAAVAGTVLAVFVGDGVAVGKGDALFAIDPDDGAA